MSSARSGNVAAYRAAATYGGVAASDPHGLIVLLMDGALQRISKARGCIVHKSFAEKAQLLHRAVAIIDELSRSLNMQAGGPLAQNLLDLYNYMCRQLLRATVENNVSILDEVTKLLQDLRDNWAQIPKQLRASTNP